MTPQPKQSYSRADELVDLLLLIALVSIFLVIPVALITLLY